MNSLHVEKIESLVGMVVSIGLYSIRLIIGIVTQSLAIIADAFHSLCDAFTSLIVYTTGRIAEKLANQDHLYGHGKAQLVNSHLIYHLAISGFIKYVLSC